MSHTATSGDGASHDELLETAHAIRRAVLDDDGAAVHDLLRVLAADLAGHVRAEQAHLPPAKGWSSAVDRGQQRLLELVDEALAAGEREPTECTCLVRAIEIELALRRQVRLEAALVERAGRAAYQGGT